MALSLPELILQVAVDRSDGRKFITSYGRRHGAALLLLTVWKNVPMAAYMQLSMYREKGGMNSDLMGGGGHI